MFSTMVIWEKFQDNHGIAMEAVVLSAYKTVVGQGNNTCIYVFFMVLQMLQAMYNDNIK